MRCVIARCGRTPCSGSGRPWARPWRRTKLARERQRRGHRGAQAGGVRAVAAAQRRGGTRTHPHRARQGRRAGAEAGDLLAGAVGRSAGGAVLRGRAGEALARAALGEHEVRVDGRGEPGGIPHRERHGPGARAREGARRGDAGLERLVLEVPGVAVAAPTP